MYGLNFHPLIAQENGKDDDLSPVLSEPVEKPEIGKIEADDNEVDKLRKMLAELSNGDSGALDEARERRSNTISSVGAAFGSFSHEVLQTETGIGIWWDSQTWTYDMIFFLSMR